MLAIVFVLGCRYMCKSVLTEADVIRGDGLLLKFCKKFEALYGQQSVTPNMHLHCHLKECVLDYGPIHINLMKNHTKQVHEFTPAHLEYYQIDSKFPLQSNNWDNVCT